MKYDRTKKLFGDETFAQFQDIKLILLGVGGVGSFALDALITLELKILQLLILILMKIQI